MTENEIAELVRKEKARYMREWRRKNVEKARATNNRYWERKALERLNADEQSEAVV